VAGVVLAGLLSVGPATGLAASIFVSQSSSSTGGDPNFITDTSAFVVGFSGNHTAVAPLLILVGVPAGHSVPTISLPSGVDPDEAGAYYGLHNITSGTTAGVLEGTLKSGGCKDAYTCAGLTIGSGGGASENFTNWTTSPFPGGKTNPDAGVTSFSIYAYAVDIALDGSTQTIDLTGSAGGDFVIAYNCTKDGGNTPCGKHNNGGKISATPFTKAGFVPPGAKAPEASAVTLTALVLLAFGVLVFLARRRELA
jgi:hypothetical protein